MIVRNLIKHIVIRLLHKTGISKSLGIPKRAMNVREYVLEYYATYSPQQVIIYPETFQRDKPPATLNDDAISWKFKSLYNRNVPEAYVIRLPFGRVQGLTGTVITQEGLLLRDISREFGNRHLHSIFQRIKIPQQKRMRGNVAVLLTDGGNTYYHWVFDILPRFHLLQAAGVVSDIDYFVLPKIKARFQENSLQVLNIDRSRIIEADSNDFHIEAENLFVPSLPSYLGTVNKWACTFIQNSFLSNKLPEVKSGSKIYISRGKAPNRRLSNEDEITAMLTKAGFDILHAEEYSLMEQVAIFNKAAVVIAPHGSGLSNIVFCKPGTVVIDLFSSDFVVPCFWTIANNCGLHYYFLCDKEKDNSPYAPYWEGKATDYTFPKEKLRQLLDDINLLQ